VNIIFREYRIVRGERFFGILASSGALFVIGDVEGVDGAARSERDKSA